MAVDRIRHAAVHLRMLLSYEVVLKKRSASIFSKQASKVSQAYERSGASEALSIAESFKRDWTRTLVAHYTEVGKAFSKYTDQQIAQNIQKTFLSTFLEFVLREGLRKSNLINRTTTESIKKIISEGIEAELGSREIARNIRKKIGDEEAVFRSEMIARTETHNAATYSSQLKAENAGIELTREWITAHDERVRSAHREADGQKRGLKENFIVGGESLLVPGEGSASNSINCRCSVIYEPVI